jgi:hypothetical protein
MTQNDLIAELKETDNLLPKDFLKNSDLKQLASDLVTIFETKQDDLETNDKFRSNFTELVNYIYLADLSKQPQQRNKEIFKDSLISFLLNSPHPAT